MKPSLFSIEYWFDAPRRWIQYLVDQYCRIGEQTGDDYWLVELDELALTSSA